MLQIKSISKQYKTGELVQKALNDVSLDLRDNEFVSILGPSGSGKTTLLNIIGGLDCYDSGDLIINGISTKKYRDRDWDAYRNHTIGFVFQSYNLIPHQSILSNVELALTIAGLSRGERIRRAKQALEAVGLGGQFHKRPNQMSGGQMQRVAIARALVNDPGILLADEPTGALDSETSAQIMELLKQVAKDRLVVMVTHNPELAEAYSTRIVKLRDGRVVDDSNPYEPEMGTLKEPEHMRLGKAKMGFLTSLSLSFHNLRTKKGRTILTSFAGSIGIIGIALILALSSGMNTYINGIQKDTMTSYPITISAETFDMAGMMGMRRQMMMGGSKTEVNPAPEGIHADHSSLETGKKLSVSAAENDLTAFKKYLDDPDNEIRQYLGENGVVYTYNVKFEVFSYDPNGTIVNSNAELESSSAASSGGFGAMMSSGGMSSMISGSSGTEGAKNFSELMAGSNGAVVSAVITDSYEVLYGAWPEKYNEVILVLDERNSISTESLYQLGLITRDEYQKIIEQIESGEKAEEISLDYETVCRHTLYLVPACDHYAENEDGTFAYIDDGSLQIERLLENSLELKITGVVRPMEDAANASISTAMAYTSGLTSFMIGRTDESAVVIAQEADPTVNVLNSMRFEAMDDAQKIEEAKAYVSGLGISDKASLHRMIVYYQMQNTDEADSEAETDGQPESQEGEFPMGAGGSAGMSMDETAMAAATDRWLEETPDDEILLSIYDEYISGASYQANMKCFGKVSYDAPDSISIYTDSFEAKEAVAECIANYNRTAEDDKQITYTDYVELMTSSLTSIVNVISYVLIAFVAVSLVVSCLMIGIITHISVLERTKEIGILRALGASKRNISQVFNAETLIIGLCAGLLGISLAALLTVPISAIIQSLLGTDSLIVSLSAGHAAALAGISVVITVISGLFPAKKAARKDPVIALRTE